MHVTRELKQCTIIAPWNKNSIKIEIDFFNIMKGTKEQKISTISMQSDGVNFDISNFDY